MISRLSAAAGVAAVSVLVSACTSHVANDSADSGAAAKNVAARFFTALLSGHAQTVHETACRHGWTGPRHFSYVAASSMPGGHSNKALLSQLEPEARRVDAGWIVRLFPHGESDIPSLLVVSVNGRDEVCGYRPH